MAVTIRMQRQGKTHRPFYHIVVTDRRNPRDGKFIERVGHYDPLAEPSVFKINEDRIKHWYSKGAILSNTVGIMLKKTNVKLSRKPS